MFLVLLWCISLHGSVRSTQGGISLVSSNMYSSTVRYIPIFLLNHLSAFPYHLLQPYSSHAKILTSFALFWTKNQIIIFGEVHFVMKQIIPHGYTFEKGCGRNSFTISYCQQASVSWHISSVIHRIWWQMKGEIDDQFSSYVNSNLMF